MSCQKWYSELVTSSDTNQSVQSQKMNIGWTFWIMIKNHNYRDSAINVSANKGGDQRTRLHT